MSPLSGPSQPGLPRITSLDGLRALAVLAVFVHHAWGVPFLWMGVDVFFVLSGFLITQLLLKDAGQPRYYSGFYWRRFLRIFPPYYTFLLLVFIATPHVASDWYWYVLYLSNIRESFGQPSAEHLTPLWSLATEEQFYIVWPLVVGLLPRNALAVFCVVIIVAMTALRVGASSWFDDFRPAYHLFRFDALAAGALIALYLPRLHGSPVAAPRFIISAGIFLSAALLIGFAAFPAFRTNANSIVFNGLGYSAVCGIAVVALILALHVDVAKRLLETPVLVWIGRVSYTIYLYHKACIALARDVLHIPSVGVGFVALAMTLMIAWGSWELLERPLMRLRARHV